MEIAEKDEYPHLGLSNGPLWREGYHFNGYDKVKRIGISISVGILPTSGVVEEVVTVYLEDPFLFIGTKMPYREDAIMLDNLRMDPLIPLDKWKIRMKDSFQKTRNGCPSNASEGVEFDLCFESDSSPNGYSTGGGVRYDQPGFLRGRIRVGERPFEFEGRGIRDHSWEIRDFSKWGEWYGLMGCFESGETLVLSLMETDNKKSCNGWVRTDRYHSICEAQLEPYFSGNILKESLIHVKTSKSVLEMTSKLLSFILTSTGDAERKYHIFESLVLLNGSKGHGFLWCGR